jgi:Type II secretion system (T2SS), protein E, N-terminal domain
MSPSVKTRQAIGEILVEKELITPAQLEAALDYQRAEGGLLGEILVAQGLIDRLAIASVLAKQWSSSPRERTTDDPREAAPPAPPAPPAEDVAVLHRRIAELEGVIKQQNAELARRKEQLELLAEIVSGQVAPTSPASGEAAQTGAATRQFEVVPRPGAAAMPPRLGDLLVSKGFITQEQLSEALVEAKETGDRVGRVLLRKNFVFEPELARTLSEQWAIPYLNLSVISVDRHAARLLPCEIGAKYAAIPVRYLDGAVQVAFADPSDGEALAAVREHIPAIAPGVAELSDIASAWRTLRPEG